MSESFDNDYDNYQDSLEEKKECRECGKTIPEDEWYCSQACRIASDN